MTRYKIWGAFAVVLTILLSWIVAPGCGKEAIAERVEFQTELLGVGGSEPFMNEPPSGIEAWTIELSEAIAALGPVYLFEGQPLMGWLDLRRLLLPYAYAHPGHYQEGEALGEVREQVVVDLLAAEPTILGVMNAVTGECHSAQVGIGTPEDGIEGVERLEGHALLLRGQASRDDISLPFKAWLDIDLFVEGLDFEHQIDDSTGSLLVEVDLQRWLRRIDFDTATPGESPTDPVTFDENSQAHNALSRGVDNTLAYSLRWLPQEER